MRCIEQKYFLTLLATRYMYPGCYVPKTLIGVANFGPGCSVPRPGAKHRINCQHNQALVRHLASDFDHRRRLACWDRPATPHCENRRCAVRLITLAADAFLIAKLLFPPPVTSAPPGVPKHNHDLKDCPYTHRKLPRLIL